MFFSILYVNGLPYFSTGLPDSPINRKLAEQKARQIELDFVSGNFDPSLDKYRTPNISPPTLNSTYEPVAAHIHPWLIHAPYNRKGKAATF